MKKILSVILAVLILSSAMLVQAVEPSANLFDVTFLPATKTFFVEATDNLDGTNRVLLVVKNDKDNVVYMNALNEAEANDAKFSVDLGDSLKNGEYTFILSSDGDTKSQQLKTCSAEFEVEADFFDVVYNEEKNSFVVTGNITKNDADCVNSILLMVYDPMFNGQSDLYYMSALNEHKGAFRFEVPLSNASPVGEYVFVISSDGDVVTEGSRTCEFTPDFVTFGTLTQGATIGGTYTLKNGETGAAVIIAVYKEDANGNRVLVRANSSDVVVNGKVTAQITIASDEDITSYSAKAFVWKDMTSLVPLKASSPIN